MMLGAADIKLKERYFDLIALRYRTNALEEKV
jgi:hypothetical protein